MGACLSGFAAHPAIDCSGGFTPPYYYPCEEESSNGCGGVKPPPRTAPQPPVVSGRGAEGVRRRVEARCCSPLVNHLTPGPHVQVLSAMFLSVIVNFILRDAGWSVALPVCVHLSICAKTLRSAALC